MKNQNGLTLIAVIITIIVLIILAVVSISYSTSNNGILNNSQKASKNIKESEGKEYIIEAWGYALSNIRDNYVPYNDTNSARGIQRKVDELFTRYISDYGTGALVEQDEGGYLYTITVDGKNYSAFKIKLVLKGEKETKYFYIVNDTDVYTSEEASEI